MDKDYPRALALYAIACGGGEKWACDRRGVLTAWIGEHPGWLATQARATAKNQ